MITIQTKFKCGNCTTVAMTEGIPYDYPMIPPIPQLPPGWTSINRVPICPNHTITVDGKEIEH